MSPSMAPISSVAKIAPRSRSRASVRGGAARPTRQRPRSITTIVKPVATQTESSAIHCGYE
jgi:hypothetical protein